MFKSFTFAAALCLAAGGLAVQDAGAEEFQIPPIEIPADAELVVQNETVQSECGDCHMVFPPSRLTQNAWRKIMGSLDNHFGENAYIPDDIAKEIEDYLVANAFDKEMRIPVKMRIDAWKKKGIVDSIRITELPEWTRHHSGGKYEKMSQAVGYDRGSNCIKCHKKAEYGYYEEFPGLFGMH